MPDVELCGATYDFGALIGQPGKIVSVCAKPAGHDPRGPHTTEKRDVSWRHDDREKTV